MTNTNTTTTERATKAERARVYMQTACQHYAAAATSTDRADARFQLAMADLWSDCADHARTVNATGEWVR